jgi:hypothetical protein
MCVTDCTLGVVVPCFFTITASGSEQAEARDQRVFLLHHPLVPTCPYCNPKLHIPLFSSPGALSFRRALHADSQI